MSTCATWPSAWSCWPLEAWSCLRTHQHLHRRNRWVGCLHLSPPSLQDHVLYGSKAGSCCVVSIICKRCAVQVASSGSAAAVLAARLHVAHCCVTGQLSSLQDGVSRNLQLLRQLLPELAQQHNGLELGSATVDPSVLQSLSAGLGNAGGFLGRLCCSLCVKQCGTTI